MQHDRRPRATHRRTTTASRDDWRTPHNIHVPWDRRIRFTGDAAATARNALAANFFAADGTGAGDALRTKWSNLGPRVWCNPPFSKAAPFARAAIAAAREGVTVVILVPSATDTRYWRELARRAQEIWVSAGRIAFRDPVTGHQAPNNPIGSTIFLLGPSISPAPFLGSFEAKTGEPADEISRIVFYETPLGI